MADTDDGWRMTDGGYGWRMADGGWRMTGFKKKEKTVFFNFFFFCLFVFRFFFSFSVQFPAKEAFLCEVCLRFTDFLNCHTRCSWIGPFTVGIGKPSLNCHGGFPFVPFDASTENAQGKFSSGNYTARARTTTA